MTTNTYTDAVVTAVNSLLDVDRALEIGEVCFIAGWHPELAGYYITSGMFGTIRGAAVGYRVGTNSMKQEINPMFETDPTNPNGATVGIDPATVRREIEAQLRAEVLQIAELCAATGVPNMAATFLSEMKSLSEVRAALAGMQASAGSSLAEDPLTRMQREARQAKPGALAEAMRAKYQTPGDHAEEDVENAKPSMADLMRREFGSQKGAA